MFAVLVDPVALARVIPGCHALDKVCENHYRADITLGIGVVKARYAADIQLTDLQPPHALRLAGAGSSSLGQAQGAGSVRLQAHGSGTLLSYDYDVAVGGKVAAVGSRMLEGAAKIVLKQLFEQLGRQAGREAPDSPAAAQEGSPHRASRASASPSQDTPGLLQRLRAMFGGKS